MKEQFIITLFAADRPVCVTMTTKLGHIYAEVHRILTTLHLDPHDRVEVCRWQPGVRDWNLVERFTWQG